MLFCVFLLAFGVHAETIEIVVEGKRPQSAETASLTVIEGDQLKEKSFASLSEVLREVPGVMVAKSGGPGQPASIFVRGARADHTLVLVDGVEANDPTTTSRSFDFSNLASDNVERIEVYRGAQSLRFGSDAVGGVINIITKKGHGKNRISYSAEGGSFDTGAAAGSTSGSIDAFQYSAGGSLMSAQGFSAADESEGNSERDSSRRASFSTRLGWEASPKLSVDFTFRNTDTRTSLDFRGGQGGDDPNYVSHLREKMAGLTFVSKRERLLSSLSANYSTADRDYENDPDPVHSDDYHEHFRSQVSAVETQHKYEFTPATSLELGLKARNETSQSTQLLNGTTSEQQRNFASSFDEFLMFKHSGTRASLDAGFRFSNLRPAAHAETFSLSPALHAHDGTTVRFTHGTGFKSPSLYQLYSNFGTRNLSPEHSSSSEISIERKFGAALFAALTAFRNQYRNLIDFENSTMKYKNTGAARAQGFEAQTRWTLVSTFAVQASYTYLESKDENTGLKLLRRPQNSFAVQVQWSKEAWGATFAVRGVGERDDIDPVGFQRIKMPSYTVADATLSREFFRALKTYVRVENLLSAKYQEVAGFGSAGFSAYVGLGGDF